MNVPGAGLQIHGNIPEAIKFPMGNMGRGQQMFMFATEPWIQFPAEEWNNMLETVFTEMVDLWNEKHAGERHDPSEKVEEAGDATADESPEGGLPGSHHNDPPEQFFMEPQIWRGAKETSPCASVTAIDS